MQKKEVERIFRTSSSSNELFDAFNFAINKKISDQDLYKTLLWNRALSPDEIILYAEKICKEMPGFSYNIYMWVGRIFAVGSLTGVHYDKAMKYFKKAALIDEKSPEPFLSIAEMYNKELNIPPFEEVVGSLEEGLKNIHNKKELCLVLSNIYREAGNIEKARKFRRMGERY